MDFLSKIHPSVLQFILIDLTILIFAFISVLIISNHIDNRGRSVVLNSGKVFLLTMAIMVGTSIHLLAIEYKALTLSIDYNSRTVDDGRLRVYIHKSVPKKYHSGVLWAIDNWNNSLGKEVFEFAGYSDVNDSNGFVNSDVFQNQKSILIVFGKIVGKSPESVANTETYSASSRMGQHRVSISAIITISTDYNYTTRSEKLSPQKFDFESIVLHELGHTLNPEGKHVDNESAVMFRGTSEGQQTRILKKADIDFARRGLQ